jgi:hypothetical protein
MLNMKNLNLNKDNSSSLLNNSIVGSQTKESVLLIFKSLKLKLFNKLAYQKISLKHKFQALQLIKFNIFQKLIYK